MAWDGGGWPEYVTVAERKRQAERAVAQLRRAGQKVTPVTVAGPRIAATVWGRAWCDNLQTYQDYESRLPRGRSYVRSGAVLDLQVTTGRITALVQGSELYRVAISVRETLPADWRAICAECAGGIDSVVELLRGKLSKSVMERLCRQQGGLFPRPSEMRFTCTCYDFAAMCKHVAAALYAVGARLDEQPALLFGLRGVAEGELVSGIGAAAKLTGTGLAPGRRLKTADLSALFGLDLAPAPADSPPTPASRDVKPRPAVKAAPKMPARARSPAKPKLPMPVAAKSPGRTKAAPAKPAVKSRATPRAPSASASARRG